MKILFVGISGYDYPHTRVRCFNFARELSRYGFHSEVLSFHDDLGNRFSEAEMYGIPDRWKLWLNLKALKRLWRFTGQYVYLQKIHYHAALPFFLARLGLYTLIFDLDDWDEHCLCLFNRSFLNWFFFGSRHYEEIVRRAARLAAFCIVSSHALRNRIKPYQAKTYIVPTGVDSDKFRTIQREEHSEIVCGWTGLVWGETIYRSVMMMVQAFSFARKECSELKLRIVGSGQLMPLVKQALAQSYSDLPVRILDWVHPDAMVEQLHTFDIGLLPFLARDEHDLTWIQSKSPTKLFEYLATGLPTVATALGEVTHIIQDGENGYLVNTPEEMAEKIVLLAHSYRLRQQMGQKARQSVQDRYSLTVLGARLAEIVQDRVSEGGHHGRSLDR
ncbi:glycosyltransferase family 4 protein [bacterium]|nr:glycosyltransferase family 4 protein [bacterium]